MSKVQVWLVKRKLKKGRSWAIQWVDPATGRRHTESVGRDKAYATQKAAERRREIQDGVYRSITVINYDRFVTEHLEAICGILAAGTCNEHRSVLEQFKVACHPKDLKVIDYAMLERFRKARLADGVSPATVNKCLRTLQGILEQAVKRNYIKTNPFAGHRRALWVKEPEPMPRIVDRKDFDRLLAVCTDDRWTGIVTVGFYGGLRRGEVLALTWDAIDFDAGAIHINNENGHRTKSRKIRTVPMTQQVRAALQKLRFGMLKGGFVFCHANGRPMLNNFTRIYNRLLAEAGLVDGQGKPLFTFHDLRRSCATELLRCGVPPKTVQKILGHADLSTTMKYYVGVQDKDLQDAMRRLEKIG